MILAATIAALYDVFALYPLRPGITACSCCVETKDRETLESMPLRQLSCDQLSQFAFKAMTTWGEAADYKHFLPRILELAATNEGQGWPGFGFEEVADKILKAGWRSWSVGERATVKKWFEDARAVAAASASDEVAWASKEVLAALARLS